MYDLSEVIILLEDAIGKVPAKSAFCFFSRDDSGTGMFFCFKSKKKMLENLDDFFEVIQDILKNEEGEGYENNINNVEDVIKILQAIINKPTFPVDLTDLNNKIKRVFSILQQDLEYIGSVADLCNSDDEWPREFRKDFRCYESLFAPESPIHESEFDGFSQLISTYGY